MIEYKFSTTPPDNWDLQCEESNNFFHSTAWLQVMRKGFSSHPLYVWEVNGNIRFIINVFKVGPFKIGYLGFPVGGALSGNLDHEYIEALRISKLPIDLLRIPISEFSNQTQLKLKSHTAPETCIRNLSSWDINKLKKLQRAIKKAKKSDLTITEFMKDHDGKELFDLYKSTINSKGGNLRYTLDYFRALVQLSHDNSNVRILAAYSCTKLAGYIIVAFHSNNAYYLHGATASEYKQYGASDLLFFKAITWAKFSGMNSFNLMSSPPTQKGLTRYKEKLGGETRPHHTYEMTINPLYATLFKLASTANLIYKRIINKLR